LLLGLDVGTSAVKAAVVDEAGRELSHGRAKTPWRQVPTGAELDPDELLAAALEAARAALKGHEVIGIGVASMAETGVLADDGLRPVVPSIAWYDTRGAEEAARIGAELPEFAERTGQPPSAMCTLAKYAWMRRHWPDARRGTRWLNVAEWIVLGLGGEPGAEASLASRTGFYDLHTGTAWAPAMTWADAPTTLAPPHAPAGTPLGRVATQGDPAPPAAAPPGRPAPPAAAPLAGAKGAVLAVGGHDHAAAAVGAGAAAEGDVLDSCGTAEAILRATAPLDPATVRRAVADGFTVGRHALPGRFVLQGAFWSGERLQAIAERFGVDSPEFHQGLEEAGATGADVLARMEALAGPRNRLVVTGGWSEGAAARAVKQRHLGPFEHVAEGYAGCRGAALAALRAASRDS
jgi:sugar (pentulose or hexulose) kinase